MKKVLAAVLVTLALVSLLVACTDPTEGTDNTTTTTPTTNDPVTPSGNVSFTDVNDKMYVSTDKLNVRSTPSSENSTNIVGQLAKGTEVTRTGYNADWSRIIYQGDVRYVSSLYLSASPVETDDPNKPSDTAVPDDQFTAVNEIVFVHPTEDDGKGNDVYVKGGEVNAYSSASTSDWAAKFADGTKLTRTGITKENNTEYGWSRVKTEDNKVYYIRNSQLSTVDPNGATDSTTTTATNDSTATPDTGSTTTTTAAANN